MTKTVSLETAKALKEARWATKTEKYWQLDREAEMMLGHECPTLCSFVNGEPEPHNFWAGPIIAAPDVSELLEALPHSLGIGPNKINQSLMLYKCHPEGRNKYFAGYADTGTDEKKYTGSIYRENPAEALAALWIELKKQNLL